jgi:hypothetical protein
LEKYQSQEVAWNKIEKEPLKDYKTVFVYFGYYSSGEEDF